MDRISDGGELLLEIDPSGGKQQDYRIGLYPKFSLRRGR